MNGRKLEHTRIMQEKGWYKYSCLHDIRRNTRRPKTRWSTNLKSKLSQLNRCKPVIKGK